MTAPGHATFLEEIKNRHKFRPYFYSTNWLEIDENDAIDEIDAIDAIN